MNITRRIIAAVIALALTFALCACASSSPAPSGNTGAPAQQSAAESPFTFTYKGTEITLSEDAAPIIEKLGEPVNYFEAESCAFKGLDKSYTYSEIVLDTYPDGETDRVSAIRLTTDTVSTPEGICLGDALDKVISVYGSGYTQDVNSYMYSKGGVKLTFIIKDDKVSSISYSIA